MEKLTAYSRSIVKDELEVYHLASYLPYGLMFEAADGNTYQMHGLGDNGVWLRHEGGMTMHHPRNTVKPILVSSSELPKELKGGKKKFLSMEMYQKLFEHHFDLFDSAVAVGIAISFLSVCIEVKYGKSTETSERIAVWTVLGTLVIIFQLFLYFNGFYDCRH